MNTTFFENAVFQSLGDFSAGDVFLAAVSGGCDSVAMLAALVKLSKKKTHP